MHQITYRVRAVAGRPLWSARVLLASITDYLAVYESPEMQLNATRRLNQAGIMLPMFRSRPMTVECREPSVWLIYLPRAPLASRSRHTR